MVLCVVALLLNYLNKLDTTSKSESNVEYWVDHAIALILVVTNMVLIGVVIYFQTFRTAASMGAGKVSNSSSRNRRISDGAPLSSAKSSAEQRKQSF